MKKHGLILLLISCLCAPIAAQGGKGVFGFLELPVAAHMGAYGGSNVAVKDADPSYAIINPSLLNEQTHNVLSLNFTDYIADVMFGSVAYGYNYKDNYFAAGIQFLDYGNFQGMTETGESTSPFHAKDFSLNLTYARRLNELFSVGVNLKTIYSVYERYTSVGMTADIGAYFNTLDKLFSMGLVCSNIGGQLKPFYPGDRLEMAPINLQLGMALKLAHAPLRISINTHNLQRWDLSYPITNQPTNSMNQQQSSTGAMQFFDMALRHAIFAVDILPHRNLYLTLSYNHRRMADFRDAGFKSMTGLAFGAGIKVYQFRVDFAMAQYQRGNFAYHVSLCMAIEDFKKKTL